MTVFRGSDVELIPLAGRRSGDPLRRSAVRAASSVRIVEIEPAARRKAHVHPESEEIIVVVRGRARVWIDGEFHEVMAGDVVHIPAGAAHATVADEPVLLHCFFPHPDLGDNYVETDVTVEGG